MIEDPGFEAIGDHEVAEPGHSECVLSLAGDVDETIERARRAHQQWGYVGTFADPDGHLSLATVD